MSDRHPLFMPVIFVGGLIFGVGLAVSRMARPEVVLDFLQFEDFGLLLVMGGAAVTTGIVFGLLEWRGSRAPLTGQDYARRLKSFDRNVLAGGVIFGAGWGIAGICPGAAYASLGIGNLPILWALAGMFLGAYVQGYWRESIRGDAGATAAGVADD
ncbi:YeeE/YedE family protein [Salinibaculum rarum]|uniref:YeeE/YedE family protein n=1 Tax=Salinibaculum rarum TaxID=3058903 RepID=UPI0026602E9F|nr:DUF6691 family protein [Salinibaculum sp. KK48]